MKHYLACDIGGTDLKYGILDKDYNFKYKSSTPTKAKEGGPEIIKQIINIYNELNGEYDIKGIAISSAGVIDPETTQVLDATNAITNYIGLNVSDEINKHIKIPVTVENDVNCMTLCESKLGAGKNAKSIVGLTIGTGIGGALVINNQLFSGNGFSAGEWGNMTIEGNIYEDIASTRALVNSAKKIDQNLDSGIKVFEQYDKGNKEIIEVVNNFFNNLTIGITNIIYAFNPEVFILGGGITARGERFLEEIKRRVKPRISDYIYSKTKIVLAEYKNDAGTLGAFVNFENRKL